MRCKTIFVAIIVSTILSPCITAQQGNFPALTGAYLGQEPPKKTPEIFAPGVVSTDSTFEFSITFSPNGKEILFTRRTKGTKGSLENRIYYMKGEGGIWKYPHLSSLSDGYPESEPNFSPDGKRIFFNSRRPLPSSITTGHEMNVWVGRQENGAWKTGEVLGPPVSDQMPMFVTQTYDGTIYFTGNIDRGIYRAEYKSGGFCEPERLPEEINYRYWAGHPFVDPEERYIIFDSNVDQKSTKNLYISFNIGQNKWSPSININKHINFPHHASMPHVTHDGQYLFLSSNGDIYWVNTSFIEDLKTEFKHKK